jgi:ketosteroid isomerase-like protein/uncharacterized protein YciI
MKAQRLLRPIAIVVLALAAGVLPAANAPRLFIVHFTVGPAWDSARPSGDQKFAKEHTAALVRWRRDGTLVIGARYGSTSLAVLRAADATAARAILESDPAVAGGIYKATLDEFQPFYHGSTEPPLATPEALVVRAHYAAFNARNAPALLDLCADDIKWFSVVGDRLNTDLQGRARLQEWLTGYFASRPAARSEIADLQQTGPIVLVRELATVPDSDAQIRRQTAFGLFEVRAGKIARVWYYPAQRDATP